MTKRAVLVGINDYTGQFPDGSSNLSGCVADANSMTQLLTDGFDFDPGALTTLTDTAAGRDAIISALQTMIAASQPGDVACFFYAGHGGRLNANPNDPAS